MAIVVVKRLMAIDSTFFGV